ncbi:MAG TPA: SDR family oxidoreductase [Ktedonobacterales bacterium]|nr:SDR family oxidoreductase [Ktedonobacterales bacterium]
MGALEGKVAVVTGSTRGLGLAIARAYTREGAAVVLCGRSSAELEQAVAEMTIHRQRVSTLVADVGELADVKRVAAHAVATYGKLDVWVNNAGVAGVFGPTASLDPAVMERAVRTNILGVYYGSLVAIQHFQAQGTGGKLINMLGRGDRKPVRLQNAYAPTKAWVRSFTGALAKEYAGTGIGVYMLNPGLMDTALLRQVTVVRGFEEKVKPLATVMRLWANPPEAPAETAVWLASSATDRKTGVEKHTLTTAGILAGLFREAGRQILRRPAPDMTLDIRSVEPYNVWATEPSEV